ncbi:hypothetical protein A3759_21050 [Thalassolituus sp. HI0120]|nr:hypothetical protein A3759_21050 [Thalassolituus sp. HI0120]
MPAPQTINHQYKSCAHVRIISILFIVTFLILVNLSLSTTRAIDNLNNEWHEYSAQTQHKFHLISQIRASLGYAGFIHHYKNYVIRRDANYLVQAKQSMTDTQRLLRQYLELPIHQEEMHALNGLATIMGNYKRKLQGINHALATRLSVSKLDERIHVDDRFAAEALATLNIHLENNYHKVKQQTDSLLNTAQNRVQILTWLGIPALIVFTLYSSYLVIRTTSAKNNLETLFSVIPDGLLVVDSRGKVIRANPKVSEIFGYSEDEIKTGQYVTCWITALSAMHPAIRFLWSALAASIFTVPIKVVKDCLSILKWRRSRTKRRLTLSLSFAHAKRSWN